MPARKKHKGKIFIVDDDELIVLMLARFLRAAGHTVRTVGAFERVMGDILAAPPDVILLDIGIPVKNGLELLLDIKAAGISSQVIMFTSDDSAASAVQAMKSGAADYITKPFDMEAVGIVVENMLQRRRLEHEVEHLREITCAHFFQHDIIGVSPAIERIRSGIARIGQAGVACVLITGESGTGKELAAKSLHHALHGDCMEGCAPFIAVNCAALTETLAESELFGHERGAFTDAKAERKGFFEMADGGSILLDEIGEMRPDMQAMLLRVLEERAIRRVGGKAMIPVDVLVIATTNRNLDQAVQERIFRSDLFFRLNTFHLIIPPLRERKEDIPVLARHFLQLFATQYNNRVLADFTPEAEAILAGHRWPGNVRELKNVVERLVVLEHEPRVQPDMLPPQMCVPASPDGGQEHPLFQLPDAGIDLDGLQKDLMRQAMKKARNNKSQAARLLGMTYDSFRYQSRLIGLE